MKIDLSWSIWLLISITKDLKSEGYVMVFVRVVSMAMGTVTVRVNTTRTLPHEIKLVEKLSRDIF